MLHVFGKVEAVVVGRFVIIRNKRLLVQETVYCILPQEEMTFVESLEGLVGELPPPPPPRESFLT